MINRQHYLNDRDVTIVLAALRQFQYTPNHSVEHLVDTTLLNSNEIDALCERISSTAPTRCRTEPDDAAGSPWSQFVAAVSATGIRLERFTSAVYWCADCPCLFVPDVDVDTIYPDRAVPIGIFGDPDIDHDCPCHALPYQWSIPAPSPHHRG